MPSARRCASSSRKVRQRLSSGAPSQRRRSRTWVYTDGSLAPLANDPSYQARMSSWPSVVSSSPSTRFSTDRAAQPILNTGCPGAAAASSASLARALTVRNDRPPRIVPRNSRRIGTRSAAGISVSSTCLDSEPRDRVPRPAARAFLTQFDNGKPATMYSAPPNSTIAIGVRRSCPLVRPGIASTRCVDGPMPRFSMMMLNRFATRSQRGGRRSSGCFMFEILSTLEVFFRD